VQLLARDGTIPGLVALGMLLVIISGGIDLSVGSVVALVTVVTMQTYRALYRDESSIPLASTCGVLAGVAAGACCGLINGLVVTKLRITPFVATLGMFAVARGLAVWLAKRTLVAFPKGGSPHWADALARVHFVENSWLIFNPGFWTLVLAAFLVLIMLRLTVLGRYVYAVGSNEATARLCGVSVDRVKLAVYTISGILTGWAGILTFCQGSSGDPSAAETLELQVIAAVVIGGASLSGGRGGVFGAMTGVLILQILDNGVSLFNVPVEMRYILIGVIIVANTALAQWRGRVGVDSIGVYGKT
jgi:ribose transport system permease protein